MHELKMNQAYSQINLIQMQTWTKASLPAWKKNPSSKHPFFIPALNGAPQREGAKVFAVNGSPAARLLIRRVPPAEV